MTKFLMQHDVIELLRTSIAHIRGRNAAQVWGP